MNRDQVTEGQIAQAAKTVYHEARHAEQWFRMARWVAGESGSWIEDERVVYADIASDIDPGILSKAAAQPLRSTSAGHTDDPTSGDAARMLALNRQMLAETDAWWTQVYGEKGQERGNVLFDLAKHQGQEAICQEELDAARGDVKTAERERADVQAALAGAGRSYAAQLAQYGHKVAGGNATFIDYLLLSFEDLKVTLLRGRTAELDIKLADAQRRVADAYKELLLTVGPGRVEAREKYQALAEEADTRALAARVEAEWETSGAR